MLLLIVMFLLQVILPAAASNAVSCHTDISVEATCPDNCAIHSGQSDGTAHAISHAKGDLGSAMQCMPAMGSVNVSVEAPMPVPVSTLLSIERWFDAGTILPSLSGPTQDRPPQSV